MAKEKIVSADEAAAIIHDGDTVCISGCVGIGTPDELLIALERRFCETSSPANLTLVFAAAPGDAKDRGLNRLAHPGLVKRAIGGHWALIPKLGALALAGRIEAYNLPLGCISQLYRNIAAHGPGVISKVGLGTFVDPRLQGGKLNDATVEDLVEVVRFDDQDWLRYKSFPIHVALLRGTTADPAGNVTMEREALPLDGLAMATAAKNSGGFVIVQVERIAASEFAQPARRADPRHPRRLRRGRRSGEPHADLRHDLQPRLFGPAARGDGPGESRSTLDERKIIARRCAFELPPGGVVNLGIGMPEGLAAVASEEHVLKLVTLTAESGVIGGMPQGGGDFGAALNPDAVIELNQQIDFYDGGGLDLACLGMAQATRQATSMSAVSARIWRARRLHQHLAERPQARVRRHVHERRPRGRGRGRQAAHRARRHGPQVRGQGRADHLQRRAGRPRPGRPVLYVTERCVLRRTADGVEPRGVADRIGYILAGWRPLRRAGHDARSSAPTILPIRCRADSTMPSGSSDRTSTS